MWWWILVWSLLLVGAAVTLALLAWHVVKQAIALGRQLGASAEEASLALAAIRQPYRPGPSVLSDPAFVPAPAGRRPPARRGRRRS